VADQLAAPADVGILLGIDPADLDVPRATLVGEGATAVVQAAAGRQRILAVAGDTAELLGDSDSWLQLPQWPVTAVATVALDGAALATGAAGSGGATYRRHGSRLWRGCGWQTHRGEPSTVIVVYDHGYPPLDQRLQLARSAVLGLVRGVYPNAEALTQVRLGDYAATFEAMTARMDASPFLADALRGQYGHRAGLVRFG
jgi:hypothetical protein